MVLSLRGLLLLFLVLAVLPDLLANSTRSQVLAKKRRPLVALRRFKWITQHQSRVIKKMPNLFPVLLKASHRVYNDCQANMQTRPWNCTFRKFRLPFLANPLAKKLLFTKESAYMSSLMMAIISSYIARGCMDSDLMFDCYCSNEAQPISLPEDHMWNGCGDNILFGQNTAALLLDPEVPPASDDNEAWAALRLMERHNNRVGRKAVSYHSKIECKCHGATGTCPTKVCFRILGEMHLYGKYLFDKYENATIVTADKTSDGYEYLRSIDGSNTKLQVDDLAYLEHSPSYCERNDKWGILGTKGRECSRLSHTPESCSTFCCNRGYRVVNEEVTRRCECRFVWCCRVICDSCVSRVDKAYCN